MLDREVGRVAGRVDAGPASRHLLSESTRMKPCSPAEPAQRRPVQLRQGDDAVDLQLALARVDHDLPARGTSA